MGETITIKRTAGTNAISITGTLFVGSVHPLATNFPQGAILTLFASDGRFEGDTPLVSTTAASSDGTATLDLRAEALKPYFAGIVGVNGRMLPYVVAFRAYLRLDDDSQVVLAGSVPVHYAPVTFEPDGTAVSLRGATGAAGATGARGVGVASISSADGVMTLSLTDGTSYQVPLPVGPQGPTGKTGATGATGATGPQGETGAKGSTGTGISSVSQPTATTFLISLTDGTSYTVTLPTVTNALLKTKDIPSFDASDESKTEGDLWDQVQKLTQFVRGETVT